MPRVVEHLARRALLDHLARVQDADAIAHLRDHAEVVADEHQRGPEFLAQRRDQVQHLGLDGRVERGRRLVEDQQRRLGRERHRDHGALQHAARELMRVAAHHAGRVGDPHLLEHLPAALERLLALDAGELEHLGDLPPDLDRRVQRPPGLLVDHRDRARAQLAQLAALQRRARRGRRSRSRRCSPCRCAPDSGRRPARSSTCRSPTRRRARRTRRGRSGTRHRARRGSAAAHAVGDVDVLDRERVGCAVVAGGPAGVSATVLIARAPLDRVGDQGHGTTSVAIASASNSTSHQ